MSKSPNRKLFNKIPTICGYIKLLDIMPNTWESEELCADEAVITAARTSTDKGLVNPKKDAKLLMYLWENKHMTPFEMVDYKFEIVAPLFVAVQWLRHRTGSFNMMSARYIEIEESFYKPVKMSVFTWKDGIASEVDTIMKPIDSMRYYKSFLRTGMMSMNPQTGHVKAWVGGINYRHFQYDMVKQGKRQIGSTFKPFVYTAAIDQLHYSPCDEFPDVPFCIEANKYGNPEEWCPRNSGGENDYGGTRTLKNALGNSVNTVTAQLIDKVGPKTVVDLAKKLGIESEMLPVPSIALGTPDISVYEMVGAYSSFANHGVYTKPVMVTSIEDKNGTILYQFKPVTRDVLSEETAYVAVKLMEGVTQGGSGTRLRHSFNRNRQDYKEVITGYPYGFENPIAGKTGTTQNQSDGWFMGMVPNLVTGVWVGAEDRAAHFKTITYGQGAAMALPIWGLYMKSCYADEELKISKEEFEAPENLSINVDCSKHTSTIDTEEETEEETPDDLDFG